MASEQKRLRLMPAKSLQRASLKKYVSQLTNQEEKKKYLDSKKRKKHKESIKGLKKLILLNRH